MLATCRSPAGWLSRAACATTKNCFGGLEVLSQGIQIERKEHDEHELARRSLLLARRFAPDNRCPRSWTFPVVLAFGNPHGRGLCSHRAFRAAHRARSICSDRANAAHCDRALHLVGSGTLLPKIPRARDPGSV